LLTKSAAMLPPAPERDSTTTGCLRLSASFSATARATTSSGPPAAEETMILTGWVG
jgi:hypothetical protein